MQLLGRIEKRVRRELYAPQGLTLRPSDTEAVISDLFLWRQDDGWKTFFELLDIFTLVEPANVPGKRAVTLMIFDRFGQTVSEQKLSVNPGGRQTESISDLLPRTIGEYGTFACFHVGHKPSTVSKQIFIAERGYCGYARSKDGPRSYVHGNLDAVALGSLGIEQVGAPGLLASTYRLQVLIEPEATYELAFVNPSKKVRRFEITQEGSNFREMRRVRLLPRQSANVNLGKWRPGHTLVSIRSRLPMARPLVFFRQGDAFDVFHG
jgi:hypothetical protein